MSIPKAVADRVMSRINVSDSGCWEWTGGIAGTGYGMIWDGTRVRSAHRVSWEIHNESLVPDGMFVLHRCDNRPCINPEHLFVGTARDNTLDMMSKGRGGQSAHNGEDNGSAKLTEDSVREIRGLRDDGATLAIIAEEYGVTEANVSSICRRKTWKGVA